jgi:ABC-type sugar transport system ATPase subunit
MVSIAGLGMRFASGGRAVSVLSDVTLEVPARQFLAVAGPSGSGKSTLLGLIAGLDRPTAGSITVGGVDITRLDEDALARFRLDTIGYIFQSFHLVPTLTAEENVAVPLELAGRAGRAAAGARLARRAGPRRPRGPLSRAALGGRAAARGGGARGGAAAGSAAGRRAHRQSRFRHRQAHHRADRGVEPLPGQHARAGHPRRGPGRPRDRLVTLRDGRIVSDEGAR